MALYPDREKYNARYEDIASQRYGKEPAGWLVAHEELIINQPGRKALAVTCDTSASHVVGRDKFMSPGSIRSGDEVLRREAVRRVSGSWVNGTASQTSTGAVQTGTPSEGSNGTDDGLAQRETGSTRCLG